MSNMHGELTLLHKEASFVVVDKPGGLLSVPGRGPDNQDCVVNRVKAMFPTCIDQPSVHRLDMFTSGIMVLALTTEAHSHLSYQFREKMVEKRYVAVVNGIVTQLQGEITLAFRLDPENRPYQVFDPAQGRIGITRWRKLGVEEGKTRVEFIPLTGRTHQLRLHAAHKLGLGCPIVGDRLYGSGREGEKMLLHASSLAFLHPTTKVRLVFGSSPPF